MSLGFEEGVLGEVKKTRVRRGGFIHDIGRHKWYKYANQFQKLIGLYNNHITNENTKEAQKVLIEDMASLIEDVVASDPKLIKFACDAQKLQIDTTMKRVKMKGPFPWDFPVDCWFQISTFLRDPI